MADQTQDEYQPVKFYAENTKPKKAGFSKFQVGDSYYFCRYVDGKIAMLSQAYTSRPGRDNGIASVKKNEKLAKRYSFDKRGKTGHGFSLKAGNGQEIAISPNYKSLTDAQNAASRMSGKTFGKAAPAKSSIAKKKPAVKKTAMKKPSAKAASFTSKDGRIENYRPLSFYKANGAMKAGFNSFENNGAYYFHYVENGKIALISESYTSKRGRDNGIASVTKNMRLKSAYQHHVHKNGKHYFDLNAANKQEIATSAWYSSKESAMAGAASLRGESAKPRSANDEDNYQPLAFYRKHTKGKKEGFETFQGPDGEYYFAYFENSKLALISEGYPTAAIRDKGVASVEKNLKIEKRYVQGTGADGKKGFVLKAGNHKEIARSVGYGSAAAAIAGAAYLMGTRRRAAVKTVAIKKPAVKTSATKKKTTRKATSKKTGATPLVAGSVVAAGLAGKAAAKTSKVKAASVPVKAAAIAAAPIAGVAVAAAAATVDPKPEPKAAVAAPVAAAAPAAGGGKGIWGWLKWLLLFLLALLALFLLFKACAGGDKETGTVTPDVTEAAAPAAMVSCWDGSKAKDNVACPLKVTCWDDSFAASDSACPAKPVTKDYECWDGSKAVDLAGCPIQPAIEEPTPEVTPKAPVVTPKAPVVTPKMTAPSVAGRYCGPSPNVLYNVTDQTPVNVTRLGSNPQFGNSLSLTPTEFFNRLQVRYQTNSNDKSFLDYMAKSLGYTSFENMDASMFSNDTLAQGSSGLLGVGSEHAVQFSTLNVTDPSHLEAFKVRSSNGTDVHFMKRCGNFMYVCRP